MFRQSKGKCRWNDEIYKLKIWIVSEKVLPVLTTYISHPSSSSYNIIFLCTMLDSRHRCETIISEKEWWGNFFFSFFLFSTHIHTRSQWIFFLLSFLFSLFSLSLLLVPFHIQLKHIPFDDDYVLYTIACLCKFLSNNMVRICVKLRSLHFQLNYTLYLMYNSFHKVDYSVFHLS